MKTARPRPGRTLGATAAELERRGLTPWWNPTVAPATASVRAALAAGPVARERLGWLGVDDAPRLADGSTAVDAFAFDGRGAAAISLVTELPGVTPAMVDWWFAWHSDDPYRYKLWHPGAHVHAEWATRPPQAGSSRSRYVDQVSIVDEHVGNGLGRYRIQFRAPAAIGLEGDPAIGADAKTAVCARVGLADVPLDVGYLAHVVTRHAEGSAMWSRFWIGGRYAAFRGRASLLDPLIPLVSRFEAPTQADVAGLMSHCSEEMQHLATFLPSLWSRAGDLA